MFTNINRIFKFAFNDFLRNKGISLSAIFVLSIITFLATFLFVFYGATNFFISQIQNKIDITAYFKDGTSEQDIFDVKNQIMKISDKVTSVEYVSKDDALKKFSEAHKDSDVFMQAIKEVGENPLLPSLNIKTSGDLASYKDISDILSSDNLSVLIDSVDFSQKKDIMEKVFSITTSVKNYGMALEVILIFIGAMIVFNTIKLAIDTEKEEINTMRIVGAGDWFVRGPFIFQGAIYGFFAFIICFVLSILLSYFLSAKISLILPGFNLFSYFVSNLLVLIAIQFVASVGLGVGTSYIAVKKYLEI